MRQGLYLQLQALPGRFFNISPPASGQGHRGDRLQVGSDRLWLQDQNATPPFRTSSFGRISAGGSKEVASRPLSLRKDSAQARNCLCISRGGVGAIGRFYVSDAAKSLWHTWGYAEESRVCCIPLCLLLRMLGSKVHQRAEVHNAA